MSGRFRNGLCPCGSGRKFKRCCADALEDPRRIARQHDAVGRRIQAWAFEHHRDAMCDAFAQITSGYTENQRFRQLGVVSYGFSPYTATLEEAATEHGDDERIRLQEVRRGPRLLYDVVADLAAGR